MPDVPLTCQKLALNQLVAVKARTMLKMVAMRPATLRCPWLVSQLSSLVNSASAPQMIMYKTLWT